MPADWIFALTKRSVKALAAHVAAVGERFMFAVHTKSTRGGDIELTRGVYSCLSEELDPLGEGHLRAVVDRARLAAHVDLPGVRAALPTAARLLLTTEGAADLST